MHLPWEDWPSYYSLLQQQYWLLVPQDNLYLTADYLGFRQNVSRIRQTWVESTLNTSKLCNLGCYFYLSQSVSWYEQ